jgi:ATP-dependent Clp protease ATP-binding subunit ClpX
MSRSDPSTTTSKALDLYQRTDQVVGQEKARQQLAVLFERQWQVAQGTLATTEEGAILGGRSGVGKSMLARAMCQLSGLPYAEVDATQYTDRGYVGLDLAQMFLPLINSAARMYDEKRQQQPYSVQKLRSVPSVMKRPMAELEEIVKLAESGVVLLDEFDKWMLQGIDASGRNVGRKLQAELLKMVEGSYQYVSDSEDELGVPFDTSRVLVLTAGAFVGLFKAVARRLELETINPELDENFYKQIDPTDFVRFGLLPELAGRLATHIFLRPLQAEQLARIAEMNGSIEEYRLRFAALGCGWDVPETAVRYIAAVALGRETGARGLKHVLWQVFSEALFQASATEVPLKVVYRANQHMAQLEPI